MYEKFRSRIPDWLWLWAPYLLLIVLCWVQFQTYFADYIGDYPRHYHSWAQFDRYALALGFLDNGFDFFHPTTHCVFKPYATEGAGVFGTAITSVDFPINEYIIAILMKITGNDSPLVFRMYTFTLGCIFLLALLRLTTKVSKSTWKGLFFTLIPLFSPVFSDYQMGFLPTIPALAFTMIGLNFLHHYFSQSRLKPLLWAVAFLTLAASIRTPFAMYLLALIGGMLVTGIRSKSMDFKQLSIPLLGLFFVGAYFLYNQHLRSLHGSMFLGTPLIPTSWDVFAEVWEQVVKEWGAQYLTPISYWLISILFALWLMNRTRVRKKTSPLWRYFMVFIFLGSLSYSLLMVTQFYNHDYYFLDTFFLPFLFLAWTPFVFLDGFVSLDNILLRLEWKPTRLFKIASLLVLFIVMNTHLFNVWKRRHYDEWNDIAEVEDYFSISSDLLDSWNVSSNDTVLVIGGRTTQGPLIFMDRKGYSYPYDIMPDSAYQVLFSQPFSVIMGVNKWLLNTDTFHTELKYHLRLLGTNDTVSAFQFDPSPIQQTFEELYTIKPKTDALLDTIMHPNGITFQPEALYYDFWKTPSPPGASDLFISFDSQMKIGSTFSIAVVEHLPEEEKITYFKIDNLDEPNWRTSRRSLELHPSTKRIHIYLYNNKQSAIELKNFYSGLFPSSGH